MKHPGEVREAILEGARIELIPSETYGWYAWVESVDETIEGRTAAEVFLKIAELISTHAEGAAIQ